MSLLENFAAGIPVSRQAPRGGKFWLRHNLKDKAPKYTPEPPSAPYAGPGKGVSGESVNSAGSGSAQDSTWNATDKNRIS